MTTRYEQKANDSKSIHGQTRKISRGCEYYGIWRVLGSLRCCGVYREGDGEVPDDHGQFAVVTAPYNILLC